MKLFAVVFGAAVAASMVSALGEAQDVIETGEFAWIGTCGDYQIWETTDMNDGCSVGDDALPESPCLAGKFVLADDLGVSPQDIKFSCCGQEGSLGPKCELLFITELTCPTSVTEIINNLDCNKCLYKVFAPTTPTQYGDLCPNTCDKPCCPDNIDDTFHDALTTGPEDFESVTGMEYPGIDFDDTKLFISKSAQTTGWEKVDMDETSDDKWCLPATCDCCENVGTTLTIRPFVYQQQAAYTIPAPVCTGSETDVKATYAISPPYMQSFPGASSHVCVTYDPNANPSQKISFSASSDGLGPIYDGDYTYYMHSQNPDGSDFEGLNALVTIGCFDKLDGSNTALLNDTQDYTSNRESYDYSG